VSSVQFTDLAEGLAHSTGSTGLSTGPAGRSGQASPHWNVEVWSSNRNCHHPEIQYPTVKEISNGVVIQRVWRPAFRQHSFLGRILNSIWMQKLWWWRLFFTPSCQPDIIVLGTDPLFSVVLAPFLRWIRPKAKIAHWCFDLYPEAAVADGVVGEKNFLVRALQWFLKPAYGACDLVADLGSCMAERLKAYPIKKEITLTPWALEEPAKSLAFNKVERKKLFGKASLGLLYSGSFGRAHDYQLTLELARRLRGKAALTYSARGSRLDELKKAITSEDANIHFAEFVPPEKLEARLSAPDVHVVSLRPEWTGTVVPSKFFGALAAGRPVLFEGSLDCSLAQWIRKYKVGWVLTSSTLDRVTKDLTAFSKNSEIKTKMFKHCHQIYQTHFSRKTNIERWNKELAEL